MIEEPNPYAPPRADITAVPAERPADLPDASLGQRLTNVIVDYVVRMVLAFGLGYVLARAQVPISGGSTGILFTVLTLIGYYVIFEYFFGFTVGKLLTGTRVVDRMGGRPRFSQILGRTLARWFPFEPFSFLGSAPTGWHDRWSGTRVVRLPAPLGDSVNPER